jgi:hypothetical protein
MFKRKKTKKINVRIRKRDVEKKTWFYHRETNINKLVLDLQKKFIKDEKEAKNGNKKIEIHKLK